MALKVEFKLTVLDWYNSMLNKMLSYRRDRAAGCVIVFAKSSRLKLGDNILQTL